MVRVRVGIRPGGIARAFAPREPRPIRMTVERVRVRVRVRARVRVGIVIRVRVRVRVRVRIMVRIRVGVRPGRIARAFAPPTPSPIRRTIARVADSVTSG